MEKKRKFTLIFLFGFIFAFAFTGIISASGADDFKKLIQITATYATDHESGNSNYAQFLVYINSIEEDINSVLRTMDEDFTEKDITDILGEPQENSWALSEDGANEVQLSEPVPAWINKQIFDGSEVQLKISITPTLMGTGGIIYKAKIYNIIKWLPSSFDLKEKIAEIEKLAATFNLDTNLITANNLAEKSANFKELSRAYFEQTSESCESALTDLLGSEYKKASKKIITKTYELYNSKNNLVLADLEICDECVPEEIILDMVFEQNGQEVTYSLVRKTPQEYAGLGINGIKAELIEANKGMSQAIEDGFFAEAYTFTQEMKILHQYWNEKISEDPSLELPYVDMLQFYNGLFEGYPLIKTSYEQKVVFEKVLFREFDENQEEICYNKIDDNSNSFIDCEEDTCSGQVCGTKIITTDENGTIVETEVELYCINGLCQEKENFTKLTSSVCGNSLCEEGESETCKKDCTTCPAYSSLTCSGKVIFGGEDANGCPLAPICVEDSISCKASSDCVQPLCGTSECVQGSCQLTKIGLCKESECTDGEQKVQFCSNSQKIVSELCSRGVWKQTGERCSEDPITTEITAGIEPVKTGSCTKQSDCAADNVCSLGKCTQISSNAIEPKTIPEAQKIQAQSVTGNVVDITGEPITGTWSTGVVPNPEEENVLGPVDETKVPQRTYNDGKSAMSSFTGVARDENVNVEPAFVLNEEDLLTGKFTGNKVLTPGVKNEFILTATCTETSQDSKAEFVFTAAGEKFGAIAELTKSYEENGEEWSKWQLQNLLIEREKIVQSFDEDFARWFEQYLANNADSWSNKEKTINGFYSSIIDNLESTAKMMDNANLKALSEYSLITIDYENQDIFSLKYTEKVKDVRLENMKSSVSLISPSMEVLIFAPEEFIKASLINSMGSREFPGSRLSKAQRIDNKGLTDSELLKFKENEALKQKIREITADLGDNILDGQFSVVDADDEGSQQIIYNIYFQLDEDKLLMEPMPVESIPVVDVKISVQFDEIYNVLYLSEETKAKTYTLNPPWEGGFNPGKSWTLVKSWVKMQLALNSMMGSVDVTPDTKSDETKGLLKDIFFLIAEREDKPQQ